MITFKLRDEADQVVELLADSRDVLVWEKTSRKGETFVTLTQSMNMVALYRLAHITARRKLEYGGSLADFEEAYRIDINDGAEASDVFPTQ